MITKFIEGSDNVLYGKWMVAKFDPIESGARSALPGFETQSLFTGGGQRKLAPDALLVVDLQTGQGAHFRPAGSNARADLAEREIWVCPLFPQFLDWLYEQDLTDITALPSFIDLKESP